jgi:hypothetical protein
MLPARGEEYFVLPALGRMEKKNAHGACFIFKSMEQGRTFCIGVSSVDGTRHVHIDSHTALFVRKKVGAGPGNIAANGFGIASG